MSKCQNRVGKKCIQWKGKNIYYKNEKDLSKRLNVHINTVKTIIRSKEINRIVYGEDGYIEKIDMKTATLPLLRKIFTGRKGFSNQQLLFGKKISGKYLVDKLSVNDMINVLINIETKLMYSDKFEYRYASIGYKNFAFELEDFVNNYVEKKYSGAIIEEINYKVITKKTKKVLKIDDYNIREVFNYNITKYCNIQYEKDTDGNCVKKFLFKKLPKVNKKIINNLGNDDGVKIKEIIDFTDKYKITCNIYDVNGILIHENNYDNKSYASLSFIVYNNHIYPLATNKPKKIKSCGKYEIIKNGFIEIKKLIEKKIVPHDINIVEVTDNKQKVNIVSFSVDKMKYIANDEYEECKKILNLFGLEKQIYDSIKIQNLGSIIEQSYLNEKIDSFLPKQELFIKGGYLYKTENLDIEKDIFTIDKNKAYPYCLWSLEYLINCDWRIAKITKNPQKIIDHYLYIAQPKEHTILIPYTNVYTGYYLKECKEFGVQFKLLEEITTQITINFYKKMIDDLLKKVSNEYFKKIMNILIGKFEKNTCVKTIFKCDGILNKNESELHDGFKINLDNKHNLVFSESISVTDIYNRKPIAIQIKDESRMLLFKKMKELKLEDKDIVQIKTDSVSFYAKKIGVPLKPEYDENGINKYEGIMDYEELWKQFPCNDKKLWDKNNFHGWKLSTFNELLIYNDTEIYDYDDKTFYIKNIINESEDIMRELNICYAGTGKTYHIINNIIPKLIEKKIKFRVLTPSHKSSEEYRKLNIPCDVIQKYTFKQNNLPTEDFIIIDEIGFVDKAGHDLLYKLTMIPTTNIISYGDFGQMQSIEENKKEYNTKHYNEFMYQKTDNNLKENKRNNIPFKYYEKLKNSDDTKWLISQIEKYSTKTIKEAEFGLCYRNSIRNKYNKIKLESLGLKELDIGVKYICRTNDLLDDYNIYNNKIVTITEHVYCKETKTMFYFLDDGNFLEETQINKNFDLGYVLNIYQVQGMTLESYFWCNEDNIWLNRKEKGRIAYTIISRLKGNIY